MQQPIIIACDFKSKEELLAFLEPFDGQTLFLKIGMELFYKEGRELVEACQNMGHRIFLDLKLHDIPNTVGSAMRNLRDLNADFITIHAPGGFEMMRQAQLALEGTNTKILAVTVLTSIDETVLQTELLNDTPVQTLALHYAQLAQKAGIAGCICSAFESKQIKESIGNDFLCVTPGIRLVEGQADDQKRVMTPVQAKENGADHMVIGRAITQHENPVEIYKTIEEQLNGTHR